MAIRSALYFNPGLAVFLYVLHEPEGYYWNLIKNAVKLIEVKDFTHFGHARLHHNAHKADIIRLLALHYYMHRLHVVPIKANAWGSNTPNDFNMA